MAIAAANGAAKIDASEWDAEVLESDVPVMVDFMADWCPPCKVIAPEIDAIKEEFAGRAKVYKLDTDTYEEFMPRYNMRSIPTVLIFKNGEVVDTLHGAQSRKTLRERLQKHV